MNNTVSYKIAKQFEETFPATKVEYVVDASEMVFTADQKDETMYFAPTLAELMELFISMNVGTSLKEICPVKRSDEYMVSISCEAVPFIIQRTALTFIDAFALCLIELQKNLEDKS
jgi:hypothetical protein